MDTLYGTDLIEDEKMCTDRSNCSAETTKLRTENKVLRRKNERLSRKFPRGHQFDVRFVGRQFFVSLGSPVNYKIFITILADVDKLHSKQVL